MNVINETPGLEEFVELRFAAGAEPVSHQALKNGLDHSVYVATVRDERSVLIGTGRIIGDGGCYYQIVDLFIHPDQKEHGLEEVILSNLLDFLHEYASADATIMVMSDVAGMKWYQKQGFKLVYPDYYGMTRKVGRHSAISDI
ncbi:GNAT family N-acetyltransferase [Paenibacillus sp. HJL G12]|uniref:GNAT family N-acetyltransferase n=1 Tax=Paenibacillus dendrobii TaxID=2691084 RepID=A0A7X3IGF5_9BACL|nr:GNAT family N-acetyltransferase [Paenibacillus dendrobii]MWV42956.1 GNAT family N-acetyltransferase [Paenibacillus dendrobii]